MSKNAVPIPIQNPVIDKDSNRFSLTYQRIFKNLFDDWVSENQLKNVSDVDSSFKFSINGNICFYNFNRVKDGILTITLPYPLKVGTKFNGILYAAGTKEITIDSSISYLDGWYFVDFQS